MIDTITLICLMDGDSVEQVFSVRIDKTYSVADLKGRIKKKNPTAFDNVDLKDTTLWKVNIPDVDEAAIRKPVDENDNKIEKMQPTRKIGEYFHKPKEDHIHVIVGKCLFTYPSILCFQPLTLTFSFPTAVSYSTCPTIHMITYVICHHAYVIIVNLMYHPSSSRHHRSCRKASPQ